MTDLGTIWWERSKDAIDRASDPTDYGVVVEAVRQRDGEEYEGLFGFSWGQYGNSTITHVRFAADTPLPAVAAFVCADCLTAEERASGLPFPTSGAVWSRLGILGAAPHLRELHQVIRAYLAIIEPAPEAEDALLPCPFCGGGGVLTENVTHGWVACSVCHAVGPSVMREREKAELAWNGRPAQKLEVTQEQVEEIANRLLDYEIEGPPLDAMRARLSVALMFAGFAIAPALDPVDPAVEAVRALLTDAVGVEKGIAARYSAQVADAVRAADAAVREREGV